MYGCACTYFIFAPNNFCNYNKLGYCCTEPQKWPLPPNEIRHTSELPLEVCIITLLM